MSQKVIDEIDRAVAIQKEVDRRVRLGTIAHTKKTIERLDLEIAKLQERRDLYMRHLGALEVVVASCPK